ncbi:hypothetical protein DsansV1_C06g0064561 [Dioscorea sansibarensis]
MVFDLHPDLISVPFHQNFFSILSKVLFFLLCPIERFEFYC